MSSLYNWVTDFERLTFVSKLTKQYVVLFDITISQVEYVIGAYTWQFSFIQFAYVFEWGDFQKTATEIASC